jgi:hypothetical protein
VRSTPAKPGLRSPSLYTYWRDAGVEVLKSKSFYCKSMNQRVRLSLAFVVLFISQALSIARAQQAVSGSYGCGTGCSVEEKQLSRPTRMGNGWSKVLVELRQECWSGIEGDPNPNRGGRGCTHGTTWKTWYFAKCNGDLWGEGSASDGRDAYTRKIYDDGGNPITYNAGGAIYDKWKALCQSPH